MYKTKHSELWPSELLWLWLICCAQVSHISSVICDRHQHLGWKHQRHQHQQGGCMMQEMQHGQIQTTIYVSKSREKSYGTNTQTAPKQQKQQYFFLLCLGASLCNSGLLAGVKWDQKCSGSIQNGPCQVDQISSRTNRASSWHKPTRSPVRRPQVGSVRMSER